MSYRKIEIDGKEYEYTIGKTSLKIKGGKSYNKWGPTIEFYVGRQTVWLEHPQITPEAVKQLFNKKTKVNQHESRKND